MAYNKLGLTTQIPNEVTILGSKYNRKVKLGNLLVHYQKNDKASNYRGRGEVYLLQILDAIKDIKRIPGANVNDSLRGLIHLIKNMNESEQERLVKYSKDYRPMVRALLGAIMEQIGNTSFGKLKKSLNGLTSYKIGIDASILPNKDKWRIR